MRSQNAVVHPQSLLRRAEDLSNRFFGRGGEFQIGFRVNALRQSSCLFPLQSLVETVGQDGFKRGVILRGRLGRPS